jgi:hypothetical protein
LDDRSLSASSGWTRATGSAYFHQTATTTTRTGASLYRSGAAVRRIAVVATTCATCGTVGVYLGSTLLERISLRSSSTANQRVLGALTLSALRTGTITVRALDAHKVVVDGVAVSAR